MKEGILIEETEEALLKGMTGRIASIVVIKVIAEIDDEF